MIAGLACGACQKTRARAEPDKEVKEPAPAPGPVTRNPPQRPGGPLKLDQLRVPPGFSIELYTDEVAHARSLARGPAGVTYVSTRRSDRVYAVVDRDGDQRVDEVLTVADGLDTPNGIAYREGDLYIAEISRILRLPDIDDHLREPPDPVTLPIRLPSEEQHGWRYIRFGPDDRLYVAIGAPCNVCLSEDPIFATIARLSPDDYEPGGALEVYASGIRNSVGFDWQPETGELWFTDNGRDELGDDIPPDELNRAPRPGLDFGFPHCHGGYILDPRYGEGHTCDEFVAPVQKLGPHVAALGMRFYTGEMFPSRYRNSVILAEHGSWNRSEKIGYRVMHVPLDESGAAVGYEPLVEGFLDPQSGEVWGRPVDVAILDDGSLIISDDFAGALYRLSHS